MNWPRGYKSLLILLISGLAAIPSQAQMKVGGQPGVTRLDAAIEIGSQKKGLLLPRVTAATLASNPLDSAAQGMMVFNIDDQTLYIKKANGYTTWNKIPDLSTYALSNLSDINFPVLPTVDQLLRYNGTKWSNWTPNYIKTISGDVSASAVDAAGNVVTTLANFGTAGTYFKTVVDAKGRVESGATALLAADIPSLATSYIQNQTAALQAGTFRIDGTGTLANLTVTSLNTQGGILFTNNTGAVAQKAAQLIWDNTNNRLGIGTATPSVALHVTGDLRVTNLNKTGGILFTSAATGLVEQDDAQLFWNGGTNRLGVGTATPTASVDVEGTFKLGADGTVLSNIYKGIITIPARNNIGTRAVSLFTVVMPVGTVLKVTDNIILNPVGTPTAGIYVAWSRVTNANANSREITVALFNSNNAQRNNAAMDYYITIISL